MPRIHFPKAERLIFDVAGNQILQSYPITIAADQEFALISSDPFVVRANGVDFLLTSDPLTNTGDINNVLLTSKRPTRKQFLENQITCKRWLKHSIFTEDTPDIIRQSWIGKFKFVKEDEEREVEGLRPPQLGALYAILSHCESPDDVAIIVMPTGTGKTEVMLCSLVVTNSNKLLVAVPSDALRSQLSKKFLELGLLRKFGVIDETCSNPCVGVMNSKFDTTEQLSDFIDKSNVVITTMSILAGYTDDKRLH